MTWRVWETEIGDDFWESPASASGHHHGETQREHADEVFRLACRHWRRVPEDKLRKCRSVCRSFLRAARFHDVGKAIDRTRHDIASYRWLLDKGDDLAAFLALMHMGRWKSRDVTRILEREPVGRFAKHPAFLRLAEMLQSCDYTAACCHPKEG